MLVFALSTAASAQPRIVRLRRGIRWVAGIEEARITARITDAPVIVYAYLSNHAACLNFEEDILSEKTFRRLSALFVMVRVEGHLRKDVMKEFQLTRYPALIFLDSAGEKLYVLDSRLTRQRVLHYMARTFFVSMYNSGRRARENGQVRRAVRRFKTLIILAQGTPPAEWAARQLKRIAADGIKKLSQAKIALDAGDDLKAMTILDELAYQYRATQAGVEAKKLMGELCKNGKQLETLAEVKRRRLADRKLRRALKLEENKDVEGALIVYWDVIRDYPKTPAETRAGERAKELVADDRALALRAAKTRMKRDCKLWMEMAKAFEQNKEKNRAIEYYQRIITHYAGTSRARKAQNAINNLLGLEPDE